MKTAIWTFVFTTIALALILVFASIFRPTTQPIGNNFIDTKFSDTPIDEELNESLASQSPIVDCGIGTFANDCFLSAAQSCSLAKMISSVELDIFGITAKSETYQEIKGLEPSGRCVFYQRAQSYDASITQANEQELLSQGITKEQISEQINSMKEAYSLTLGKDGSCKYPTADLVSYLENGRQGNISYSSEKMNEYECSGPLFNMELRPIGA